MQRVGVGLAADGEQDLVALDGGALVGFGMEAIAAFLHLGEFAAQQHFQPARFHGFAKRVAHIVVETAQGLLAAIDQAHMAAQAMEDMGEFQRDVAAARHQDALGQFVEVEGFVGGDAKIPARNHMRGAHFAGGPVAGGDQDLFRCHLLLRIDQKQRVLVLEHGAVGKDGDAGRLHILGVKAFQPRDFLILVGDEGGPIETGRAGDGPAIAGRIHKILRELAGIDHQLLGNAAADHAGAAHAVFFRQRHPRAGHRRHARSPDAA